MNKLLMMALLIAASTQAQVTTTSVNKTMPVGGYVMSIPRQKVVCYSQAGKLLIAWPGNAYSYYQTTDAGTSWSQTNLSSASYGAGVLMGHLHMAIWNDTVYTARGYTDSTFIVDKIAPNNVLVANTRVTVAGGVASAGRVIVPTIAPTGHNNDLVAVIRNENNSIAPYWFTSSNGTNWTNRGTTGLLAFDGGARHGLISNPPESTIYLEYRGSNVDVFYFNAQTPSWNRHGSSSFTSNGTQRAFSGVISGGVTFVAHQEGYVGINSREAYSVSRAPAYGSGARTVDTLWYTTAHTFDGDQPGQVCVQEIKSLSTVIVYYLKTDSTYANAAARQTHLHLYAKVWYNNAWSSEQTIDGTHYYANISAPFQVPSNHGATGYVLGNTPSQAAGYLSVVTVSTGGSSLSAPALASPSDGATGQSTSPTLVWSASSGATSYHLQVSNSSGFGTSVYDQSGLSGTSQAISGLNNSATYYWRVSASNGSETSAYSSTSSFATLVSAPAAPTLASPATGATGISTSPTLTWNASTNATSYRLQASTDAAFGTTVVDQANLTGTSSALTGLSTNTTYYWHVSAANSAGISGYSATWSFSAIVATSPIAPTLASPATGATGISTNPTLTWNTSTSATSYRLQVSTYATFSTTVVDQANLMGVSSSLTGLSTNATYYWHVSASNGAEISSYSAIWNFTTTSILPGIPTLAAPTSGATSVELSPTLSWSASTDATSYRLQVSTDAAFSATVMDQANLTGMSSALYGLSANTTYYWHVSSSNSAGTSGYSATWNFTTIVATQVTLTPTQKSLPSIGQGVYIGIPRQQAVCLSASNSLITRWGSASSPRMWRTTNAGDTWTEMSGTLPTSMAHDHLAVWNDTTYNFAGVQANRFDELIVNPEGTRNTVINQTVNNLGSDQVIFSGQPANFGNDMVGLARNGTQGMLWYLSHDRGRTWIDKGRDGIFPSQSGVTGRMGITWNLPDTPIAVVYTSGAVNIYYYEPHDTTWVRHGSTQFNLTGLRDRFYSGIVVNGYTYVAGLVSGGYRVWRARAHTSDVPVETSLYTGAVPANPYVALQEITSLNGVMVYYLHGDGSLWGRLYYNGTWLTETLLSSVAYTNMVAPFQVPVSHGNQGYLFGNTAAGSGYLVVVAIGGVSGSSLFAPVLALPSDDATGQSTSPTLSWNPSSGATSYQLEVSSSSGFGTTVYDQSGLSLTSQAISGLNNSATYYWHVSASDSSETSAYSSTNSFTTLVISPATPTLASPATGVTGISTSLTLTWNASANATSYRVQISTDAAFGTTVVDQSSITATSQAVTGLSANTTYYWHVSASNSAGTSGYSAAWTFTTNVALFPVAPTLASPSNGASGVSTNPTLTWNASTNATSYRVQVSTDAAFGTTVVDQSNITATSTVLSGLASGTTYYWHISASNMAGTSVFSTVWSFATQASTQAQVTTTSVNKTMPVGGYVMSIPRQKVVCYSQAGKLLIAWPGNAYSYYQTTDAGTSWSQTNLSSASYGAGVLMGHLHMAIWNDTVYTARGYTDSTFIVDKIAPNNVLVANTRVTVAGGVASAGRVIVPTIAPTGHNNDLVAVIRNENNSIAPYWFTSSNGTNWTNRGTTGLLAFDGGARHGLISNPPESTIYLEYRGSNVDVFYFNAQTPSWNRHGSSSFTSNGTQRAFSGVISGGVTFVAHQEGYVGMSTREAYSVFRAPAYGSGARTVDTLWYTTAHTFDGDQPGQVCVQEIKSLSTVIVYYLKTDSTYANAAARQAHLHLYAKVWYNNAWSSEQTIDGTHYYANISAPFQVPSNHGAIGYVLGNTPSQAAGYLSVVSVSTGESGPGGYAQVSSQTSISAGDEETGNELPYQFKLSQNYPNPFNPVTTIEYSLPQQSHVTIEIFNVLGQKTQTLVDREEPAGSYTTTWSGTDSWGRLVATGVYFYRLQAGDLIETKKMLLLK